MQEMVGGICNQASVGDTARLIDERDGKIYWIAKLKDNNCWMTQNLDLDLSIYNTLTPENTDLLTNWTPNANTQTGNPTGFTGNNEVISYDPGEYVYTTPTKQNRCDSSTGIAGCTSKGWQSTSGMSASSDPNFASVVSGNIYNAHYLAGNYYSWGAATAGQAASLTSNDTGEQSTQSICPKGWRLPYSKDNTTDKSFGNLLTKYGVQSNITAGDYDIRLTPLYFVYGGYVNGSSLQYAGNQGTYWSSTANNASNAYSLNFSTSVGPSSNWSRYVGMSVRCVAR